MEPLTFVCAGERADYFKARAALLRGEILGKFEGRRLLVDRSSLQAWKAGQEKSLAAAPATATT